MKNLSVLSVIVRFSDAIGINPNSIIQVAPVGVIPFCYSIMTEDEKEKHHYTVKFDGQTGEVIEYNG